MVSLARDESNLNACNKIDWVKIGTLVQRDGRQCGNRYRNLVQRCDRAAWRATDAERRGITPPPPTLPPPPPPPAPAPLGAVEKFENFVHNYRRDSSRVWTSYPTPELIQIRNVMIQVCLWLMCVCVCPANACVFYVCLAWLAGFGTSC